MSPACDYFQPRLKRACGSDRRFSALLDGQVIYLCYQHLAPFMIDNGEGRYISVKSEFRRMDRP
jgi:hypothetical protein